MLVFSFVGCDSTKTGKYEYYGKDTLEYFGNGRFVVFYPINKNDSYCLFDRKKNGYAAANIDNIEKYTDITPFLYTIGKKGYTKINYELGLYHQSSSLEKFDESDQEIFGLLENSSNKIPYSKDSHNKMKRNDDEKGPLIYLDDDGLYVIYKKEQNTFDMTYQLFDRKNNKPIDYITKYKIFNSCIYAIGKKEYIKKDYIKINLLKTEEPFSQSMNLDDFNNEDQIVFKVLDSEESTLEY
jgi:hypothetical protein